MGLAPHREMEEKIKVDTILLRCCSSFGSFKWYQVWYHQVLTRYPVAERLRALLVSVEIKF